MEDETSVLERILNGTEEPKDLPLTLLLHITDGFSEERKIGQGGFGEVYKGELGNKIVAVKRMFVNEHTVDDKAFRREIDSLMSTNYQNVVRYLGFCSHTHHEWMKHAESGERNLVNVNQRLLCSEYISNGSLDKHITGSRWSFWCEDVGVVQGRRECPFQTRKGGNRLVQHANSTRTSSRRRTRRGRRPGREVGEGSGGELGEGVVQHASSARASSAAVMAVCKVALMARLMQSVAMRARGDSH